jgi:DNA-binding transcriptional regulator GbsR (MarR family)
MSTIQKEREELIEMFGIHFELLYNLPPLGSRILGLLIVDGCKTGLTFEEIVEKMAASKSSISTNLNLLLKMDKINYYTVSGDRKKYFKPSPFSERLFNYIKILDFEKKIIDKLITYREQTISCKEEQCNMENVKAYKAHVCEVEELLIKTIEKFKEIEISNSKNN